MAKIVHRINIRKIIHHPSEHQGWWLSRGPSILGGRKILEIDTIWNDRNRPIRNVFLENVRLTIRHENSMIKDAGDFDLVPGEATRLYAIHPRQHPRMIVGKQPPFFGIGIHEVHHLRYSRYLLDIDSHSRREHDNPVNPLYGQALANLAC